MYENEAELTVTWCLTEQDLLRANWFLTWRTQLIVPAVFALIALGSFGIAILWALGCARGHWGSFVGGVLGGVMFAYFAWLQPFLAREGIRKAFRATPGAETEKTGVFSREGIALSDPLGRSEFTWQAIVEVVETRTDFLFFLSPGFAAPIIPKARIPEHDQRERLRGILTDAIGDRAKLRIEPRKD